MLTQDGIATAGRCFLLGLVIASPAAPLHAQQGQLTDVAVQGYVYEPQRLPPTDARIQSLILPQGFRVQRFAQGLDNPRMLAVADDGTVYVTQRPAGRCAQGVCAARGAAGPSGHELESERGYFGPRPPAGDPPHHYHFQLFALDTRLDLPDGFNRHALLKAMQGHVLAEGEFVGAFQAPQ